MKEIERLYRLARRTASRRRSSDIDDLTHAAFERFLVEVPALIEKQRARLQDEFARLAHDNLREEPERSPGAMYRMDLIRAKLDFSVAKFVADGETQSWLERCLRYRVLREARNIHDQCSVSDEIVDVPDPAFDGEPLLPSQIDCVRAVLESTDGQLLVRWHGGEALKHLAETTGTTISSIWRRIQAAAERMKRCIHGGPEHE